MNDASKWHILCPAQSHTAGQSRGRAQQRLPPPLLACAQQIARCGGRLGVYYTFWRASGAGPSISYPAGTHMSPGEQGSGVCAKSGVLKQARRAPTAGFERAKNRSRQSTKASKRFGPAAGFLLASARDLRFSPGAIQQGNVGLLGTQNGITRSAARRVKTPDLVLSYTDPVLNNCQKNAPLCFGVSTTNRTRLSTLFV